MDPRVDSDVDGSRNAGLSNNTGYGAGTDSYSGSAAGTGTGIAGGAGAGHHHHHHGNTLPGPAPNTAGPHKSDMMNSKKQRNPFPVFRT